MRKLLGLAGAFTIALSLTARGAGIVYTVPADYEKMKKVVEGLVGKQLNSVSLNQASNAGTNIRNFVESAAEEEGYITSYNHDAFRYAGRNYVGTMEQLTGIDINSPNTSKYGGFGGYITNGYYYFGKNVRRFMEGITNVSVYQDNSNAFYNAARNIKSFLEGIGGSSHPITGNYATAYKYAGQNIKAIGNAFKTDGKTILQSYESNFENKVKNFKLRAAQTFYDMYINPNGLKKGLSYMDGILRYRTAGLTPITKRNRVGNLGGLDDTFGVGVSLLPYGYGGNSGDVAPVVLRFTAGGKQTTYTVGFTKSEWWCEMRISPINVSFNGHTLVISRGRFYKSFIPASINSPVYVDGKYVGDLVIRCINPDYLGDAIYSVFLNLSPNVKILGDLYF